MFSPLWWELSCTHLFLVPHSPTSLWELEESHVGIFTPQNLAGYKSGLSLFIPRDLITEL
jgi:hypothetical protein